MENSVKDFFASDWGREMRAVVDWSHGHKLHPVGVGHRGWCLSVPCEQVLEVGMEAGRCRLVRRVVGDAATTTVFAECVGFQHFVMAVLIRGLHASRLSHCLT
jgi:hypothetical protein